MLVYTDIISGDEVLSSAYPLKQVVDAEGNPVEGLMYCESKMIAKGGDDVDVGCGNAFGGEAEDAGVDSAVEMVNNVIEGFSYTETQLGSAMDFKSFLKGYFMAVVTKMREAGKDKEEIQAFKKLAPGIATFLVKNYSDVQFYLGASFNADTMVYSIYPEGATTPNFYYIMGGLKENKF